MIWLRNRARDVAAEPQVGRRPRRLLMVMMRMRMMLVKKTSNRETREDVWCGVVWCGQKAGVSRPADTKTEDANGGNRQQRLVTLFGAKPSQQPRLARTRQEKPRVSKLRGGGLSFGFVEPRLARRVCRTASSPTGPKRHREKLFGPKGHRLPPISLPFARSHVSWTRVCLAVATPPAPHMFAPWKSGQPSPAQQDDSLR